MKASSPTGQLLSHLVFALNRQSDQVLQERLGLGYSQYKIMTVLLQRPHIQQKEIAGILGQTEASISRQIKVLTEQGILQAIRRPENRRECMTTLTPKGERYAAEATDILDTYLQPVFDGLSEKQQIVLGELLTAMHGQTCQGHNSTACHLMYQTIST